MLPPIVWLCNYTAILDLGCWLLRLRIILKASWCRWRLWLGKRSKENVTFQKKPQHQAHLNLPWRCTSVTLWPGWFIVSTDRHETPFCNLMWYDLGLALLLRVKPNVLLDLAKIVALVQLDWVNLTPPVWACVCLCVWVRNSEAAPSALKRCLVLLYVKYAVSF